MGHWEAPGGSLEIDFWAVSESDWETYASKARLHLSLPV